MVTPPRFAVLSLLLMSLLVAGCQSVESRIRDHAKVFAGLSGSDQQRIRDAEVRPGDSPEIVQMAYGKPDQVQEIVTSAGTKRMSWRYLERRYVKEGVKMTRVVAPFANGAQTVEDNYRVVKVVGTEVVFLDGEVVQVRGGPPLAIRKLQD